MQWLIFLKLITKQKQQYFLLRTAVFVLQLKNLWIITSCKNCRAAQCETIAFVQNIEHIYCFYEMTIKNALFCPNEWKG